MQTTLRPAGLKRRQAFFFFCKYSKKPHLKLEKVHSSGFRILIT